MTQTKVTKATKGTKAGKVTKAKPPADKRLGLTALTDRLRKLLADGEAHLLTEIMVHLACDKKHAQNAICALRSAKYVKDPMAPITLDRAAGTYRYEDREGAGPSGTGCGGIIDDEDDGDR